MWLTRGLKRFLKKRVFARRGVHVEPVILAPEESDDPRIVDTRIHAAIEESMKLRETLPGMTAVFRVKNASPYLYLSISSIVPLCREIVIVDNQSTDDTRIVVERLIEDFKGVSRIRLFSYEETLSAPGKNYSASVSASPESSIAAYYNFAFSKATEDFVMKADAHMILMPFGIADIQSVMASGANIINIGGTEVFGRKIDHEPRIFRRALSLRYTDGERWEYLDVTAGGTMTIDRQVFLHRPVYIHVKALIFSRSNDAGGRFASSQLYA